MTVLPWNFSFKFHFASCCFLRIAAVAPIARATGLEIVFTSDDQVWILNRKSDATDHELCAGELCGFNLGEWHEVATGLGVCSGACFQVSASSFM